MSFFDWNGDGKKDLFDTIFEVGMAHEIINDESEEDTDWREYADDGSEYGLDPEDFDDEDEYEEALEEAMYGWRDEVEDGDKYGLDPDDYETEEEYLEALAEAKGGDDGSTITLSITIECDDEEKQTSKK